MRIHFVGVDAGCSVRFWRRVQNWRLQDFSWWFENTPVTSCLNRHLVIPPKHQLDSMRMIKSDADGKDLMVLAPNYFVSLIYKRLVVAFLSVMVMVMVMVMVTTMTYDLMMEAWRDTQSLSSDPPRRLGMRLHCSEMHCILIHCNTFWSTEIHFHALKYILMQWNTFWSTKYILCNEMHCDALHWNVFSTLKWNSP